LEEAGCTSTKWHQSFFFFKCSWNQYKNINDYILDYSYI